MTRKALAQFWEWENKAEMSLRDLMDLTIVDDVDSKPGHLVTRLLDLRCVGVIGFWTVVDRLTATDLGLECNVEWNRRLVKLEGCKEPRPTPNPAGARAHPIFENGISRFSK